MISVIKYDGGNVSSVINVLKRCNIDFVLTDSFDEIKKSKKIILPGVSNFSYCMNSLKKKELDKKLFEEVIINKKSFLGICSGMQVLGSYSSEGNAEGLNFIPGEIIKFPVEKNIISPHVGWNKINFKKNNICEGLKTNIRVYFSHSYYFKVKSEDHSFITTNYNIKFCSGVSKNNIYGIQFHPEKSLVSGMRILKNFSDHC